MRFLPAIVPVLTMLALNSADGAVVLYQADFEQPTFNVGNLDGQDGWTTHSGTGMDPQVITGQAVELAHGGGSRRDVNVGLGQTMGAGDIFSFAFDVIVNGTADAQTTYFAHFRDDATGFNSRVFVTAPNTAGSNFTFAIGETSSSTPAASFGTDFSYGQSYRVNATYAFDSGISSLTIDGGAPILSTSQADPGEDIQTFAFRQAGGNTSMVIDNLSVEVVPEPGSLFFLGTLAIAGCARIRSRRI